MGQPTSGFKHPEAVQLGHGDVQHKAREALPCQKVHSFKARAREPRVISCRLQALPDQMPDFRVVFGDQDYFSLNLH